MEIKMLRNQINRAMCHPNETQKVTQPSIAQGIKFNFQYFNLILNLVIATRFRITYTGFTNSIKLCVSDLSANNLNNEMNG